MHKKTIKQMIDRVYTTAAGKHMENDIYGTSASR
jgi:hypothetical protein